jgi:hypothetical protein
MPFWRFRSALVLWIATSSAQAQTTQIGREVAIPHHLENGQEFQISLTTLLAFGKKLFTANWTIQEGQGRPLAKGVGTPTPLSDLSSPLVFPRNFNRFSAPDANSCAGCHNAPIPGGAGDIVANVFVLGQRFDSVTMDHSDTIMTRGAVDEAGTFVDVSTFADSRVTPGHVRIRLLGAAGARNHGRSSNDREQDSTRPERSSALEGDQLWKARAQPGWQLGCVRC